MILPTLIRRLSNGASLSLLAFSIVALPVASLAWGEAGHTMINHLAAEKLPDTLPAFMRTQAAVDEIGTLGPEEDRLKGAGKSWDADNDEGHFLDIGDDGLVAGVVKLDALPPSMEAFEDALAAAHTDPYKVGYVPYTIMDGYERAREDFAYWRVYNYLATHAASEADRAKYAGDRELREGLTLRDIGDWGHFVGDGSQPLHVTIHFNGWGNYPNPNGYTTKHIHSFFESEFVDKYSKPDAVAAKILPYSSPNFDHLLTQSEIGAMVGKYLEGSASAVPELYRLYSAGDFQDGSQRAIDFTDAQLARGATMYRNLIAYAWEDSINADVGFPAVSVKAILAGATPNLGD